MLTVIKIIEEYLKKNNYSGLYDEYGECGCQMSDLAPCGDMQPDCKPGHKAFCTSECEHDEGMGNWHIQKEKP